jgi:S1-C subfamily serine protease
VLAVGNPFNLESTITAGIVSAKGRNINVLDDTYSIESFIQTDAAVNPGNSGGALVNTNGELIGITTAIITKSGRYEGYSFAIPATLVMKIVRDLREFGKVQRGFLGVHAEEVTPQLARTLGLPSAQGVHLRMVDPGKAAAEGGLRTGDVIVGVNGIPMGNKSELVEAVARYRPGNTLEIEFLRQGKRFKTKVMLKNEANSPTVSVTPKGKLAGERYGILEMRGLSQQEMRRISSRGVKVLKIQPNSVIAFTNMGTDFIITHINDQKVESPEQVHNLLEKLSGKIILEGVYDGETSAYFYTFKK